MRKPPPSGDRWLPATRSHPLPVAIRCQAVDGAGENLHRLATGGYRLPVPSATRSHPLPSGGRRYEKTSTVWRQVATGYP